MKHEAVIRRQYLFFSLLAVSLLLLIYLFYQQLLENQPGPADKPALNGSKVDGQNPATESSGQIERKVDSIDILAKGLHERLQREPDDVKGWVLLARSYKHLHRWQDAEEAFGKAKILGYVGELPAPEKTENSPLEHIFPIANQNVFFENMAKVIGPNKPDSSETSVHQGINVKLSLDPIIQSDIDPDTKVFIFAHNADEHSHTGSNSKTKPSAPLAAAVRYVRDFPLQLTLDDSLAMMPGHALSSATQLIVGARVSLSGKPMRQTGDFEQLSKPVSSDYKGAVELFIHQKIETIN